MALTFSYVLPLAAAGPGDDEEMTGYLRWLADRCELIVVDGSDPATFGQHHRSWSGFAQHVQPRFSTICGKVAGVMTGLEMASCERVVVADDDVRHGDEIHELVRRLQSADVILPQNFFDPLLWHAAWDSARSLLNRVLGGDWPGTVALNRSLLLAAGGYSGDVMFENFELCAVMAESGGRVTRADDIFVRRLPPTTAHFLEQRIRQAYDELARPPRLVLFASVAPALAALAAPARPGQRWRLTTTAVTGLTVLVVCVAEIGRHKDGAVSYFPLRCSLAAPLWFAERSVCIWAAIGARIRGGVRYRGTRIRRAALTPAERRARLKRPGLLIATQGRLVDDRVSRPSAPAWRPG